MDSAVVRGNLLKYVCFYVIICDSVSAYTQGVVFWTRKWQTEDI